MFGLFHGGQIYVGDGYFSDRKDCTAVIFKTREASEEKRQRIQSSFDRPLRVMRLMPETVRGLPYAGSLIEQMKLFAANK